MTIAATISLTHRCGAAAVLLLAALLWLPAQARERPAAVDVAIEIDAAGAGALARFLREQLDVARKATAAAGPEEWQRLADAAPAQIRELLATEGYFSPTIDYRLDRSVEPWTARYLVALGPAMRIETVEIRFAGAIAEGARADPRRIEHLRRRWALKPGERFRQEEWTDSKSSLLKGLLNRDYPAARIVDSQAAIDPQRHAARLTVEVDSGPAFTFGELRIQGLQRYPRDMIDALNPIRPGDPFSQDKLNELQARLQETGYFRSAFAAIEVDPARPEWVPVRLDLNEHERKRLGLGVGFSTDTGARVQVKWLDRNFLRRNWQLESELRLDRETRVLGGDILLPTLDGGIARGWRPGVSAHLERTDTSGEVNDKIRSGLRISSPDKADEKTWSVSYLGDRQRIAGLPPATRRALLVSFGYTKRRVDNLISPRRGYVASADIGVGLRGVVSEDSLVRTVARATWLHPFDRTWQAVLRGQVGQVAGARRQAVPADLLFRTGGDQSVRGYAYNSLGVPESGAIVGGRVTAVMSAELVYWITPQWGAAVFTDAGDAADSWRDLKLKRGSGVGARWRSPIGPVNIDLAYGHATREPRLHFSVGYGF